MFKINHRTVKTIMTIFQVAEGVALIGGAIFAGLDMKMEVAETVTKLISKKGV